ncbi:hypothetical protein [Streptomyces sp. CBMA29]|uniref:hypothetical protein n=1 Tax=Streptomyces sp. CBMA29 TaxID=1896314 RepID=UPI001661E72D|nr:hypothetical protein [Streptomyces sp. CBMA29]MBD0734059.1 hypothetical protein [Streptomyces sp. CBMA29]
MNAETTLIHRALRGYQRQVGDSMTYWRFAYNESEMDDVYDEAAGTGRAYYGPWQIPVIHVNHGEAGDTNPRDSGLYVRDTLFIIAEFNQISRAGLTDADIKHATYQRDRVAYNNSLFAVTHMDIQGQIRRRDIIVSLTCEQLRDDELVDDPQFEAYVTTDYTRLQQGFSPRRDGE